jgi:hypothetical protein
MKIGSVGVSLNYETARVIVEAAHAAWNAGSLEGVLDKYVDDLVYISNSEGENGGPLTKDIEVLIPRSGINCPKGSNRAR